MMKQWILILAMASGTSLAQAGTAKFNNDEFNQLIHENQKAENELRAKLQKDAGIDLTKEKPGTIAEEDKDASGDPEQIAVSSSTPLFKEKRSKSDEHLLKEEMKRLSQEMEEAKQ